MESADLKVEMDKTMTPLQQAYLNKLRATADANMAFFELTMPLLQRLLSKDSPKATIDISDQGDLTIRNDTGDSRSVVEEVMAMEDRLGEFSDIQKRSQILAFYRLRSISSNPGYGDMQPYHYTNLDPVFRNNAMRHFTRHYPDNSGLYRYPYFGEKHIPLVIVIGSGLGWHLNRLVLDYHIGHMIVIDVDADSFRISMFFEDYVQLSRLAMERGTTLTFMVQPEIEYVSRSLMGMLLRDLPPFFIHGTSLFYAAKEDDTVEKIKKTIVNTLWEMFFGLGYFDDELISIKHTLANLRKQIPIYVKPNQVAEDAVAFIIGSGPSLDELIPILQEHHEKAVLFSCGSSLSALTHAGIKPDFHVEKERPYLVHEILTSTVPADTLKEIDLIALNVVHPEVFTLFRDVGIVMKSADTSANLLAQLGIDREVILDTQPTVTNTALDFALSVGFKKIYLFGMDMGFKEKDKHHSSNTIYINQMPESGPLKELMSERDASDEVVPGNFGGDVSTTSVLIIARQHAEYAIGSHPDSHVYNLNDGALIKGAEPLQRVDFLLPKTQTGKEDVVKAIKGAFQAHDFDYSVLADNLLAQIDIFTNEVRSILSEVQKSRAGEIDKIARVYRLIFKERSEGTPMSVLFRGALLHMMSLTYSAITIIKDDEETLAKASYDFSNMLDFMTEARREVAEVLAEFCPT